MFERRVHIRLDEARYRRIATVARTRKMSVAAVIREALDRVLDVQLEGKRRAAAELLAAEPTPSPDVAEWKSELRSERGG